MRREPCSHCRLECGLSSARCVVAVLGSAPHTLRHVLPETQCSPWVCSLRCTTHRMVMAQRLTTIPVVMLIMAQRLTSLLSLWSC